MFSKVFLVSFLGLDLFQLQFAKNRKEKKRKEKAIITNRATVSALKYKLISYQILIIIKRQIYKGLKICNKSFLSTKNVKHIYIYHLEGIPTFKPENSRMNSKTKFRNLIMMTSKHKLFHKWIH